MRLMTTWKIRGRVAREPCRSFIRNAWLFRQTREQRGGRPVFRPRGRDVLEYVHALYEAVSTPGIRRSPPFAIRDPLSSLFYPTALPPVPRLPRHSLSEGGITTTRCPSACHAIASAKAGALPDRFDPTGVMAGATH